MSAVSGEPINVSIQRPALYIVSTPIGNLRDISLRALDILNAVDIVLAEDKRVAQKLLQHYGITATLRALHDHNEIEIADDVIANIAADKLAGALISDAGTPLISDPGYRLVRAAHVHGVPVLSIPGPSAAIAALSVAGLASDRFSFEGFLPAKAAARRTKLGDLTSDQRTLIFYEAPHRIVATLADMAEQFGDTRELVVARELTKLHETIYRGSVAQVQAQIEADSFGTKGEFVIVVGGAGDSDEEAALKRALVMVERLREFCSLKDAVALAAEFTGSKRNLVYARVHQAQRS